MSLIKDGSALTLPAADIRHDRPEQQVRTASPAVQHSADRQRAWLGTRGRHAQRVRLGDRAHVELQHPRRYCPAYGGPYCTYPWYASNSAYGAITYGADYPGTKSGYGQGSQFPVTMQCGGPYGPDSTYCDTVLKPPPLS